MSTNLPKENIEWLTFKGGEIMKSIYREVIIMAVAYTVSILCISAVNKKYNKRISSIKYILSVIIVPVSVLGERVIIWILDMVCGPFIGTEIHVMKAAIVDMIYNLVLIFISFLTIIIIFKLITECRISKNIWLVLAVCTVIGIAVSIMGAIYSSNMMSRMEDMLSGGNFLLNVYYDYKDTTKLNIISIISIVNRCMPVIFSTWSVVKQLLKRDEMNMTVES